MGKELKLGGPPPLLSALLEAVRVALDWWLGAGNLKATPQAAKIDEAFGHLSAAVNDPAAGGGK